MSSFSLYTRPARSQHTYHLKQIEAIYMSENENEDKDGKGSGSDKMDVKRIRKIVGAENLKRGFLPIKFFSFSRADAAHILFVYSNHWIWIY